MTPVEWVVVLGGVAAIAWVNWYFFLAERPEKGESGVGSRRSDALEG
ncbi:MAG TPA: hypothetical protein VGE02_03880 [Gemmatimonadales bacterium]